MENIVSYLCYKSRKVMNPNNDPNHTFEGQCGLAQSMLYHAFRDALIPYKPFTSHDLDPPWIGHVSGTIKYLGTLYLIDPTYVQFQKSTHGTPPVALLSSPEKGFKIAHDLTLKGYTTLTPESAALYINSFLNIDSGKEYSSDEAFHILQNPPWYKQKLVFGKNNIEGTRENLRRYGLLIDIPRQLQRNKLSPLSLTF